LPRGRKGVEIVWIGKDMEVGDGVREIEDKEGKNRWIYKKTMILWILQGTGNMTK
jgi:hypothetical protein